jgi:D-tagatose-1,6-bisphosphate aldolase subunit GatZ/KbaZ
VEDARAALEVTHAAFLSAGVAPAWERVIAMVVQPGVEFGDDFVLDYNPAAALGLAGFARTLPLVYEAHSTDFQTGLALCQLVQDHFAILKVGPALTFAFREAVFALALMENELFPADERSRLVETLDAAMQAEPVYWNRHYHGNERELAFARKYSLSDRIRYYWSVPQVQSGLGRMLQNLGKKPLPLTLVSQFLPVQWEKIRSRRIGNTPEALILDKVSSVLKDYARACG